MNNLPPELYRSSVMTIQPDWIDFNGHLNMAYYFVLFDRGVDELFATFGLDPGYAEKRGFTTYMAEAHVCYVKELHRDARVVSTAQVLGYDEKRLHLFQELHHEDGWLAATLESMTVSIDMSGPRVASFPPDVLAPIASLADRHRQLKPPARAGRSIRLRLP